jgi:hypothetical protein
MAYRASAVDNNLVKKCYVIEQKHCEGKNLETNLFNLV